MTTLPSTMKAARFEKNGDPQQVITVQDDVPVPTPQSGELVIKVAAASINPVDWKLVRGDFPGSNGGGIGFDVSGTVVAVGEHNDTAKDHNFQVGDRIYADTAMQGGTWATYAVVPAVAAHKVPSNIDLAAAASLPLAGLTALQGLVTQGNFQEGHRVCILGGSGGVGSLAVQVARALGASEIVATGSSVKMIQSLGADKVINYKEESVVDAIKGQEFDVIFDTIGGLEGWLAAQQGGLKKNGTYVTIVGDGDGSLIGALSKWAWRYTKHLLGWGPAYKVFLTNTKAPAVQADMKCLTELVESGKVKPVLDERSFSLTTESVREMVEVSMSHKAKGKLVLKVDC